MDLEVPAGVVLVVLHGVDLAVLPEVVLQVDHLAEEVRCTAGPEVDLVALLVVGQVALLVVGQAALLVAGLQALSGVIGVLHQRQAMNLCKGHQKDKNWMILLLVQMLNSLVRHLRL